MALALPAAQLTMTWRDESSSRATPRVWLAHSTPAASALAAAGGLVALWGGVSGASCDGYSVSYPYHVSDAAASGPQLRHQVGLFVFRCDGTDQWLTLEVPCVKESLVDSTPGRELITSDPAIANFVQYVIDGQFCNPFGYQVLSLETAFGQFIP